MQRRAFLKRSATLGLVLAVPLSGCSNAHDKTLSFDAIIHTLKSLQTKPELQFEGPWPAFATFTHIAQSIEMSVNGFPEHKSAGFKRWIGKPAFWAFKQAGAMRHDTAEAIPGAPALDVGNHDPVAINLSIQRVIDALYTFSETTLLAPHFAYGALNKDDYLIAHILHIEDHLALLKD